MVPPSGPFLARGGYQLLFGGMPAIIIPEVDLSGSVGQADSLHGLLADKELQKLSQEHVDIIRALVVMDSSPFDTQMPITHGLCLPNSCVNVLDQTSEDATTAFSLTGVIHKSCRDASRV